LAGHDGMFTIVPGHFCERLVSHRYQIPRVVKNHEVRATVQSFLTDPGLYGNGFKRDEFR